MNRLTRYLALILTILMLASPMHASVFAEDDDDMSTYIYDYNVPNNGYDGPRYQYFSPYVVDYIYDDTPSYIQNYIFSLYNTQTGHVTPVYCTDITVGAYGDRHYRKQNLEDSTYAASAADLLRSIILNGFYLETIDGESMDQHAVRVAEKLQEISAASGVENLTIGEAIAATQTAIWQAAHGTRLSFPDFFRTVYTTKMPSMTKYYDLCHEERQNGYINYTTSAYGTVTLDAECDARINARIKAVHDYLLALDPVETVTELVSNASFLYAASGDPISNGDGTFDITVNTTVDVDMVDGDNLTLTASVGDAHSTSTALSDGQQMLSMTIENVPSSIAFGDVNLSIEGNQTVSGVFLYDAYGDREAAQSMIGMASERVPVRARTRATTDRVLNFHKTTRDGLIPLEGIIFDIFPVATMEEYLSGQIDLPKPENYNYPALAEYTVMTDVNGNATFSLSNHGLPDGIYLVVEREHPAIVAPVKPFYVMMPMTNAEGTGQDFVIDINPKNDVKGNVQIDKDVDELGNDQASVGAYNIHTWIITTTIPEDIAAGKIYSITDDMDSRLDFIGNVKAQIETVDGSEILLELSNQTDYELTVHDYDSTSEAKPHDNFAFELTKEGMQLIGATLSGKNFNDYMLRVYFDAQINSNGDLGQDIPNEAILEYTNSVNFKFLAYSDRPSVNMGGGIKLVKVDADNNDQKLNGAQFQLLRSATEEEVAAGEGLIRVTGITEPLVQITFFENSDLTGNKVTHTTTNANGEAGFYGVAYGEYYLLETKAPDGYNMTGTAIKITIDATSHLAENALVVENVSGSVLPSTGGIGTTVFTVFGLMLMGISILLIVAKKRTSCE